MKTKMLMMLMALAIAGCTNPAHATATASANGRAIKAEADGYLWVHAGMDEFTVKVKGHEIVIEKDRLLVDKTEAAKFPAAATNFFVAYSNGALTVTAAGASVLTTTLAK